MQSVHSLSLGLVTILAFMLPSPKLDAQINVDEAQKHGFTAAVTTTMRLQSEKSTMVVTGKHNLLRESLLLFIRDQGFEGLKVSFPKVQWPDGSQSDPRHCGYTGEFLNGYYRFIQNNSGEAVTANQSLEAAVDQMFKRAAITVSKVNNESGTK